MRYVLRLLLILLISFSSFSCQSANPETSPGFSSRSVTHIVVCWMNDRNDAAGRDALLKSADALRKIPGVVSVAAGRVLASDRPGVDSSYDIAFVINFPTEQAMQNYLKNPEHLRLKQEVLDRYVRKVVIYDFACAK